VLSWHWVDGVLVTDWHEQLGGIDIDALQVHLTEHVPEMLQVTSGDNWGLLHTVVLVLHQWNPRHLGEWLSPGGLGLVGLLQDGLQDALGGDLNADGISGQEFAGLSEENWVDQ
jgi:hypothetical protein